MLHWRSGGPGPAGNEMVTKGRSPWPPCSVTVSPIGGITGWMSWPEDPIYRPVVGLFEHGSLRAAVPTFRNRQAISGEASVAAEDLRKTPASFVPRSSWICAFDLDVGHIGGKVHLRDISVVCLETGQVLYPELSPLDPDNRSEILEIDDIITRALCLQEPPDVSGFNDYLSLPTRDQLAVLYLAILGRPIDAGGLETFDAELTAKGATTTILDIRDRMIASPEFAKREISIYERVGLWIVWGGLCEVVPSVLSMPASLRSDPRETSASVHRQAASEWDIRFLAALALGPWKGQPLVSDLWVLDHRSIRESFRPRRSQVATAPVVSRAGIRLPDLLSSMEIGSAGAQGENGVRTIRGREGFVVFGPYLTLPPGQYDLTVFVENETPTEESADCVNDIRIEAVYGRIIMAYVLRSGRDLRQGSQVISFIVPELSMGSLDDALFEFRVWSRGLGQYYIRSLTLEVLPPDKDRNQVDWLPLMSIGGAGNRVSGDGAEVGASLTSQGHVVFGPYIQMLPGRHRLVVECTILVCAGPKTSIDAEVVIAPDEKLAAKTYELMLGAHTLELEFMINQQIFNQKEGGVVEFRVHKAAGSELIITSVNTIYDDPPRDRSDSPGISSDLSAEDVSMDRNQQPLKTHDGKGTPFPRLPYHWLLSRLPRRRGTDQPQS